MKAIIARIVFMMCCCFSVAANAQWNYPQYSMSTTTISSCFGRLYDSGGPTSSYGPSENFTTTIVSEGPVTLTFFGAFSLQEDVDFLTIYDGTVTTGSLLGIYTGQELPGAIEAQSGTVTLVFNSNSSISASGFSLYWETDVAFPVPPALSVPVIPACNSNQLSIELSSAIPCEWLESASFEVFSISEQFDVELVDLNCDADQTNQVTLTLNRPFSYNCDVIINLTIQIPDECNVLHEFEILTTFFYDNCPINAQLSAESSTVCSGECTSISLNLPGCLTYVYQWNNALEPTTGPHNVCPSSTTTYSVLVTELETNLQQTFSIEVVVEDVGIITPDQSVCQSGTPIQLQASVAGEWYGEGVLTGTSQFDPEEAGAGEHILYIQSENCLDSLTITVLPIETATSVAACVASAPFQLQASPAGGAWSGVGVSAQGVFDPANSGSYTLTYEVNGCSIESQVNVDQISGPAAISPVCQSLNPFQIEVTPAGGIWTGPGITDPQTGLFDPALATPGLVSLNYALNGCDEDFSFEVRAIGVIDSVVLCLDNAPTALDPSAQPAGGVWNSPTGAISPSGIFNPGVFSVDTETIAIYTYSTGYLCRDTVHVSVIGTEVQVSELTFCYDELPVDLDTDLLGTIAPANGTWTGTGVSGSQIEGYTLSPEDMPIGLNSIYYSANGCSDTVTVVIYGPNLPDEVQTFCSSDAPVVLADAVPGGIWSGSGIVDASEGLFDPSLAEEGTYYIYWNNPLGCGDSIQVTVEKVVTPVISGISDVYCSLDYVVDFTTEPEGGQLTGDLTDNSFNPSELPEGDYTVIYRLTPEHCPIIEATAEFTVYPPLSVEPLSTETNPVCYSETIELNAIVEGGYPENALTYIWSNGGPNAAINTQLYTQTTEVTLTVDDGCSEPVVQSIEIIVHPSYNYTAQTSAIDCPGVPGSIELIFDSNDSYEISWNGAIGDNPYGGLAGEEVEITITDENLCERDTVITIPAYTVFDFDASVPATLCMGQTGIVELTIVPAAVYTIEWNGVVGGNEFTASAGTELDILITDSYGCNKDTVLTLGMHPDFQFTLTNASILCPGVPAPVELDITPVANYNVLWNGVGDGNPNLFVSEAGATLDIAITDPYGCSKDTTLIIGSYPDFTLGVSLPAINCPGEPAEVELSLLPVGVYVIQWNGVTNNQVSYMTSSGEDVQINVEDENGCVKDTAVTAPAHPDFSVQVDVPTSLCAGELGMLDLNITPLGIYDITWNGEPGGTSYEAEAGSQVDVVVTDDFGCERDTSFEFDAFPTFNYTLTNASIVCPGEPAFVEIEYIPNGSYTVLWNGQQGNSNAYTAEAGSPLSILITDSNGCEKDTSITISSYPIFNVDVLTPAPSCPGTSATINLDITPGPSSAYSIEWNGEVRTQLFYATEAGSEVSILVTDVNGCIHDTTVAVEAFPEPIASFSIEQIGTCIPFEESGNITMTNNSVNGQSGTWYFGDGQTAEFIPGIDVTHGYAEAGTYTITLEIISADLCIDSATQQLCTLPEEPVFIPDIFSPNDDGKNDTLYVRGKFITRLEFRVYNRWGEVVFETNSVTQGWDGNVRGVPAQSGSYYYTITATVGSATRVEEVGEIVLIR